MQFEFIPWGDSVGTVDDGWKHLTYTCPGAPNDDCYVNRLAVDSNNAINCFNKTNLILLLYSSSACARSLHYMKDGKIGPYSVALSSSAWQHPRNMRGSSPRANQCANKYGF